MSAPLGAPGRRHTLNAMADQSTAGRPLVSRSRARATAARAAARTLALLTRAEKDAALRGAGRRARRCDRRVVAANAEDLERGRTGRDGREPARPAHASTRARVAAVADALRDIAALPDPVGEVVRGSTLANGLQVRQVRVPMGVVGMIYEARPNVTVDAAGLGLKSGNAVILRGGSAAASTNRALVDVLRRRSAAQGLPAGRGRSSSRAATRSSDALMTARGQVDLLIPRGGAEPHPGRRHGSTVSGHRDRHRQLPRLRRRRRRPRQGPRHHGQRQDPAAERVQRRRVAARPPDVADAFLPKALAALDAAGVVAAHRRAGAAPRPTSRGVPHVAATDEDFATEYHALEMSVGVVDGLDAALAHITRFGSGHTEAIVTESRAAGAPVHRRGRRRGRHGQRLDPVHRRRRVRVRCRDRHLDPEAARPRARWRCPS